MRKIVAFFALLFPYLLVSQSHQSQWISKVSRMKDDTLKVNYYHQIAQGYPAADSSQTTLYLRKSLELAQKLNWNDGVAQSYFLLGEHYLGLYHRSKAFSNFQLALRNTKNPKIRANIYFSIGDVYLEESNYVQALATYHQALKLFETTNDKKGIVKVLISMGSLYTGFGKNKEALESYNRALKVSKTVSNFKEEIILRGIGTVYYNFGENQKSLDYLNRSLTLIKAQKDANLESRLLSDLALVFLEMKQYQKAIHYSQASLKTDPSILGKKHNTSFSFGVIGDSYIEIAKQEKNNRKSIDSAIFYLEKAAKLHRELNSLRGLYDDYESIYEAQKLKGNYAKALEYFERCTIFKDSMYNSDNKETIKNLEDKRAIELRDREIKINQLKIETKEKQKWFFLSGIAFLVIIGGLLFYQSRNRKKNNEKLQLLNAELKQANRNKTRFFSILNHDLRSPISNLIHFLHLQKNSPDLLDSETRERLSETTLESAENLLHSMEDLLLWSKGQMEHFKPDFKTVSVEKIFQDTALYFSSEKIKINFENASQLVLTTDENYLKTIVRNLTGNALKALSQTPNPTITWKAFTQDNQIFLSITDNGPGADQEQLKALYDESEIVGVKSGLGLHLIRDLARAIGCSIKVASEKNAGSTFTLTFEASTFDELL
ncbi:sensor histidine kinase [Flavobacterium sp. CYK-4]|uniref:tetratricopeptide repeat protein n=1 Tax=Flavobacterium lotistagni TaxID=2709660 RepID=UPI00140D121C|nr:tetratricopeptide repeat protein [Flavobacterium lotistagni]NHM06722.1 sensor histidine kinase [Flavobacterium lotistagni]